MAEASSSSESGSYGTSSQDGENSSQGKTFECNICLDTAKDAVLSMCGHLFCWPCLHQWLEMQPNKQVCPVCKSGISKDKVIPVYGRGGSNKDPRSKLPPRPQGQRTEPDSSAGQSSSFPGFGLGEGGFHMAFGVGAFPFGLFTSTWNFWEPSPPPSFHYGNGPRQDATTYSKFFLWLAILLILWMWAL